MVTAASTADPPAFSMSAPISAQGAQSDVTRPLLLAWKRDGVREEGGERGGDKEEGGRDKEREEIRRKGSREEEREEIRRKGGREEEREEMRK